MQKSTHLFRAVKLLGIEHAALDKNRHREHDIYKFKFAYSEAKCNWIPVRFVSATHIFQMQSTNAQQLH